MSRFQSFENVSLTLDNLLKNYDIRLRPKFGGNFLAKYKKQNIKPDTNFLNLTLAGTLNVSMEVKIASFYGISEVNMVIF